MLVHRLLARPELEKRNFPISRWPRRVRHNACTAERVRAIRQMLRLRNVSGCILGTIGAGVAEATQSYPLPGLLRSSTQRSAVAPQYGHNDYDPAVRYRSPGLGSCCPVPNCDARAQKVRNSASCHLCSRRKPLVREKPDAVLSTLRSTSRPSSPAPNYRRVSHFRTFL